MIPPEILRQVRRIEIRTRHLVNDLFGGEYHSVFKGMGMEFAEVREYSPGDDVRSIDWNVTARTGHPHVKVLQEERELTVLFVVDQSGSERFGSRKRLKAELAAEVGALLALSAVQNNDKVGLILFTDGVELYVPPAKGRRHVLRVVREILFHAPEGRRTNLAAALDHLVRAQKRRAVVFLVSDFLTTGYERALSVASKRHDLVAVRLRDRREAELPRLGLVAFEDLETGARRLVDTSSGAVQRAFDARREARELEFHATVRHAQVDHIDLWTDSDVVAPLAGFFRRRASRRSR